jgi:site-specific DNA recombinase
LPCVITLQVSYRVCKVVLSIVVEWVKYAGGKLNPNCIRLEGIIPPIIDDETWGRVHSRMIQSDRRAENKAKREYLLSGLIECSECGATYVGHCSVNKRKDGSARETRYYECGNKYRTRSCGAKNINADLIETFVVSQLKAYLLDVDFNETAQRIADAVNSASPDCSKERSELADIDKKISNGVKAVISGMDIPELKDEIDRLRTRKSELMDIIAHKEKGGKKINPDNIVGRFNRALDSWDSDLKHIIKEFVTKIYANPDGSFSVEVGVHINGAGGRKPLVCATFVYLAA